MSTFHRRNYLAAILGAACITHETHPHVVSKAQPIERPTPPPRIPGKVGRNDLCPCGSGQKFKRCCQRTLA